MNYAPGYLPIFDGRSGATDFLFKAYGTDYDFFLLPTIDKSYGAPVQVESHIAALLHDTDDARALMAYIASGAQGEAYVKQGFKLGGSPGKRTKLEWYPDSYSRRVAEVIQKAPRLRMWAYNLVPWSVYLALSQPMTDYLDGKVTLDGALKKIDEAWAASG